MRPTGLEGEVLGSFRVLGELGRGGMAIVYRGVQESLSRPVAIKVLPFEFASSTELIKRFHREAEAMAALSHPNIVQIIDRGERDGVIYFVMEFVDGGSLKDLLGKAKEVPFKRLVEIALQVCAGLSAAHAAGIVHRDLKPGNVLVDARTGNCKIADFGIASFQQGPESATLTSSNVSMGTLNYMSPEQKLDAKSVDHRTDIYALGVILYEMFTGTLPLGSFDPPSDVNRSVPKAVDPIVLRCLKASPQQRFQSVAELAAELRKLLADEAGAGLIARAIRPVAGAFTAASTVVTGWRGRAVLVVLLLAMAGVGYVWVAQEGPFARRLPPSGGSPGGSAASSAGAPVAGAGAAGASTAASASGPTGASGVASGIAAGASAAGAGAPSGGSAASGTGGVASELRGRLDEVGAKLDVARRSAERAGAARHAAEALGRAQAVEERADALVFEGGFAAAVGVYEEAIAAYRAAAKEASEQVVLEREREAAAPGTPPGAAGGSSAAEAELAERERARREAEKVRMDAALERERAAAAGAPERAPREYARGADEEREGNRLFAEGRHADSRARFRNAADLYADAARLAEAEAPGASAGPGAAPEGEGFAAGPEGPHGRVPSGDPVGASSTTIGAGGASGAGVAPPSAGASAEPAGGAAGGADLAVRSITPVFSLVPLGRGAGQAVFPKGLAADGASGEFYLGDVEKGSVTKFSSDGRVLWEAKDLTKPHDIALSPDGATVYVANTGVNRVARLRASDGRREADWGRVGEALATWNAPYALGVGRGGELWVYDRKNLRIQRIGTDGKVAGGFQAIGGNWAGVAVDGRGRVYFSEGEGVKRWDPEDRVARPFASHVNPVQATALACDEKDRVYVADARQGRVIVLAPSAEKLREVRTGSDGALRQPLSIAVAGGRMYLLDFKARNKVHIFDVK
jgi:sugar lactone lactonase YvrE/predicted Ser/Thr protein kinase